MSLEAEWNVYAGGVLPDSALDEHRAVVENAFYAGATAALKVLGEERDDDGDMDRAVRGAWSDVQMYIQRLVGENA